MSGSGVNIATAYISIVPTIKNMQGNIAQAFQPAEREADAAGERAGGGFLSGFKGVALAGAAGAAVAVGAAFMDAFNEALDVRKSQAKIQASLGLSPQQSAELGKVAGNLYRSNYGDSIAALNEDVAAVAGTLKGLGGADLESATRKALSFSQAFGVDVADSVQSVNTLIGSGLAKDATQAFDLLTASSQKVPAALRGDLKDASDEYGQFFRTLGFSGDQAFDALVKGSQKGAFGIDKTGDAIKEFTLLSTDLTNTDVVGLYQQLGLSAQDTSNALLAGGTTAKDTFNSILNGVLSIQDPTQQAQAALTLFGTPLEDMNKADIPQFLDGLKGMSGGLGETSGAADRMDAALGSTASGLDTLWRNIKATLVDFITDKVLPAVTAFTQWLGEKLVPVVQDVSAWLGEHLGPVLQKVASFFVDVLLPAGQLAWAWFEENLLPTIQRVGQFIADTFANLTQILGGIIDFIAGVFTGDWSRAWDGVKAIFQGIWDQIQNIVGAAWDVITGIGGKILDWASALPGWVWDKIKAAGSWIADRGGEFIGWLIDGIKSGASSLWSWITGPPTDANSLLGGIWNSFLSIGSKLLEFGGKVVGWIVDGIKAGIGKVADAITGLFDDLTFNPDGTISTPDGYVTANPFAGGSARGGVIPGTDPGRRDNVLARLPDGRLWGLRSEESVFVPEFTRAIGGAATVNAWNRAAEQGRLSDYGFARGGVVDYGTTMAELTGKKMVGAGDPWAKTLIDSVLGKAKDLLGALWSNLFGSAVSGGLNPSQDPSTFGWTRGQGIVPFSWNGRPIVGGVAGGTEGLWRSLLDALVPQIPGGLTGPMWGYANRNIAGTGTPSFHSYGLAVDINAAQNGRGLPGYGRSGPGVIPGPLAASLAAKNGMMWGGDWTYTDPMHFEIHVSPGQIGSGGIISNLVSGIMSQVTGGAFPPNVERWRPLMADVLARVGAYRGLNLSGYTDRGLMQINSESSGDPNAINLYDINAQRGNPSIGLLQVIRTTFEAALRGTPFAGLIAAGQRDPRASLTASTLYSLNRYKTLDRAWRGVAYDSGGIWEPGTFGINMLNKPEAVLTPPEKDAYQTHARALAAGYGGRVMRVEFAGDGPLTEAMVSTARVTIDGTLVDLGRDIYREKAQTR